mmetsp:Transcript_97010/g.313370  ORF Transcript_97010/g.313370 Transcript_97010/m.313370 type:complete len:92 (+) Transcript_97010:222-497(+)
MASFSALRLVAWGMNVCCTGLCCMPLRPAWGVQAGKLICILGSIDAACSTVAQLHCCGAIALGGTGCMHTRQGLSVDAVTTEGLRDKECSV